MVLMYSLKGEKQKQLAAEVGKALGKPVKYLGTPIFAFQAGKYSIDQNGTLVGPDNLDLEDALHRAVELSIFLQSENTLNFNTEDSQAYF